MKIDVCYYLNEADLLTIRFEILNDYVDKFIVVECTQTFSGKEKPLAFNIERYAKWKDKIIYYVVDDYPLDDKLFATAFISPNTGGIQPWVREFYIKESARKALINLHDDDIVFISDLDEIWNPDIEYNPKENEVLKPRQLPYLYYVNQRTSEDWLGWSGTIVTRYKTIKEGLINHLRTDDLTPYTIIENGGWHLNAIGGKKQKIDAFKHPLLETKPEWDRREVDMHIDESELPKYLLDNKKTWIHLFQ